MALMQFNSRTYDQLYSDNRLVLQFARYSTRDVTGVYYHRASLLDQDALWEIWIWT